MEDTVAVFDMFFRKVPDDGGFALYAGLEQAIDYLKNLSFTENDIEYLRSKNLFSEKFLDYLRNFEFKCSIWSVPEGTPVFPKEPLMEVEGPIIQAQLVETALLAIVNHQTLIATKANRIVRSAMGRPVQEFGARRAQGIDAAVYGQPCRIYRRLCFHFKHNDRQGYGHSGLRHNGSQLGAEF